MGTSICSSGLGISAAVGGAQAQLGTRDMAAYFVTATGTDIGKTYVTAGLVRCLRARGEEAVALKPVVSGFSSAEIDRSDPGVLLRAMGLPVSEDAVAEISPWRFSAPLSPDMAAARENRSIDFGKVVDFCCARRAAFKGTMFVEGVGGVLVPLDDRHTVRDWMVALGLPLVLVAGSYLGAISHTLTAVEAVRSAGLDCALLIVNESHDSHVPLAETIATLQRFVADVPVAGLRRAGVSSEQAFSELWRAIDCFG